MTFLPPLEELPTQPYPAPTEPVVPVSVAALRSALDAAAVLLGMLSVASPELAETLSKELTLDTAWHWEAHDGAFVLVGRPGEQLTAWLERARAAAGVSGP